VTTNERLDRIEASIGQIAAGLAKTVAWHGHQQGQVQLAEIAAEQYRLASERHRAQELAAERERAGAAS
jgi:hypothetical protein